MPDHGVLERDPVRSEDGAGLASDPQRLAHVVELAQTDLFGPQTAVVLHPPQVERQQLPLAELDQHVLQLLLRDLKAPDGLAELIPGFRVIQGRFEARPGRPHHPPHDAEPGFAERRQRAAHPPHAGKLGLGR